MIITGLIIGAAAVIVTVAVLAIRASARVSVGCWGADAGQPAPHPPYQPAHLPTGRNIKTADLREDQAA